MFIFHPLSITRQFKGVPILRAIPDYPGEGGLDSAAITRLGSYHWSLAQCGIKVSPYAIGFAIGTKSCFKKFLAIKGAKTESGGEEKNTEEE